MCAERYPFQRMAQVGENEVHSPLDHDLLAKVVHTLDYLCFFDLVGGHVSLGPLSRAKLTDRLFEESADLSQVFRKPIHARISLFDHVPVPRAKTILPIHPTEPDTMHMAPAWMVELPNIKEIGVVSHRVDEDEICDLHVPSPALLSHRGAMELEDFSALGRNDFASMGYAIFAGRTPRDTNGSAKPGSWRFLHHSHRLKLFGPIDLTLAEMEARSCSYAGRPVLEMVNYAMQKQRPTAYGLGGTICGETVMASALAVPLKCEREGGPEVAILFRDLLLPPS